MMWWNNGMGYGMGWGGWVLLVLLMVAFWGFVIVGVMALFRTIGTDRHPPYDTDAPNRQSADKILDERFARGEIDAQEYRIRRDQLRTGHGR
ncbi:MULTISPECIES: SHOCT domain-containing protein [Rhodococcus]|uniref:SHOCT domain-containing protein n=1 Tax=Rhodococcus TaxID=1827 RepID=UPI001639D0F5|nr:MULTISPECIES: SHOCT domain-containing protein [Rhodococcus]MBC2644874.1 SHOCT domain-containing protein [Rhodococcus sp. 3A]MBC2890876.1 SHOCT domain-containing protein [Rhodococcus sp. 4CII]MDX5961980.1 SHOCT domain-containing protein [Rhodococcus opacus]